METMTEHDIPGDQPTLLCPKCGCLELIYDRLEKSRICSKVYLGCKDCHAALVLIINHKGKGVQLVVGAHTLPCMGG